MALYLQNTAFRLDNVLGSPYNVSHPFGSDVLSGSKFIDFAYLNHLVTRIQYQMFSRKIILSLYSSGPSDSSFNLYNPVSKQQRYPILLSIPRLFSCTYSFFALLTCKYIIVNFDKFSSFSYTLHHLADRQMLFQIPRDSFIWIE